MEDKTHDVEVEKACIGLAELQTEMASVSNQVKLLTQYISVLEAEVKAGGAVVGEGDEDEAKSEVATAESEG